MRLDGKKAPYEIYEELRQERERTKRFSHWLRRSNLRPHLDTAHKMIIYRFVISLANYTDVKQENSIINEV